MSDAVATVSGGSPDASTWPEEVEPQQLRARYADLAGYDDAELRAHFERHGREEGRIASAAALREDFVSRVPQTASILEIGPFCQPVFEGPNVRYLDVLDAGALKARGEAIGIDTSRTPQTIHYTRGLAEAAGAGLDVIFSSHNIEHQPDLIDHLREAARALRTGGQYLLIVPDRRYCFDHFLADATVANVVGAHVEGRRNHTAASVIEHRAFTCHNDTLRHWQGDHGPAPDGRDGRIAYALNEIAEANGAYIDVHAWQFTPASFRQVFTTLHQIGLSPFRPSRIYDTPYGCNEFTVVLTLDATS